MIGIAVVGAGHWGPNLIRNYDANKRSEVRWVVDLSRERLDLVAERYPGIRLTTDAAEALADDGVDGVVIASPTITHYPLVRDSLLAGKHVLVEKPLTEKAETSRELVELAAARGRILLVGHIFIYNPAVQWVKRSLDEGLLGRVYYVSSLRTNLGPVRLDVNAAWDLAAQDISIFNYWLDAAPTSVTARGGNWINSDIEDAVFATMRYPEGVLAHLHVSWLNPRKVRDITVVAEKRMLTYDDMNLTEPIRVYDKRITEDRTSAEFVDTFGSFRSSISEGDVNIPRVPLGEPLRNETEHFLDCIEQGSQPLTGGPEGLRVVEVLEAIERSMRSESREVTVCSE